MKKIKRITAVFIAAAFIMLSALSAFAANSSVEEELKEHAYKAYQVFKAADVAEGKLTSVVWGSALTEKDAQDAFLAALKADETFKTEGVSIFNDCTKANEVARVLEALGDNDEKVKAFAKLVISYDGIQYYTETNQQTGETVETFTNGDKIAEAGYYVFKDTADTYTVLNPVLVKMVTNGTVDIKIKASVPQVEKKVLEASYNNNYASKTITADVDGATVPLNYGKGYNDAADYSIGDSVPFELIGTIPENFTDYDSYYYAFHDTLSKGLTYDDEKANLTVELYDVAKDGEALVYKAVSTVNENSYSVNVTEKADGTAHEIVFENILDLSGLSANSLLIVHYNAVLNNDAVIGLPGNENEVYLQYSNNPYNTTYNPDKPDETTGETPEDKVIVFTYALDVNKVDPEGNNLKDAKFVLKNADGKYYNSESDGDSYWVDSKDNAEVLTTDSNGFFEVKGIDNGKYFLEETAAPNGFQKLQGDIEFTIDAKLLSRSTASEDAPQNWTGVPEAALPSFTASLKENSAVNLTLKNETVNLKVTNTDIYDLPGTGGSGSTVFYIVGGVLIAAALSLLVIKRRVK